MPIQATCPNCQMKLQVPDGARGKQVRCSNCKSVFVAGAAAANGNGSSIKPAGPTVKPAAARSKTATAARPKPVPQLELADDDDRPPEKKKKKSMLPACLIGCGIFFVLCGGGGGIGGYFAWKGINKVKDNAAAKLDEIQAEFDKAAAEQKRIQEEAAAEQKRKHEENQKRNQDLFNPNNPNKNRPADKPNPPDKPKPADKPPPGTVVQSVAVSILLEAKPLDVFGVLWTGTDSKQAVVALKVDKTLRLEQYDLGSGHKLGRMEMPFDTNTTVRDFSRDGNYYVCNHSGTPYSIWSMPHPKAMVDKWLPAPIKGEPSGVSSTVVAAYLLDGPRILTVNGAGQVGLWLLPTAAGAKPTLQMSYIPPTMVAKYALGLGYGFTTLSLDRKRLAVFNGSDGFFLLDTTTLQLQGTVTSPEDAQQDKARFSNMLGVSFSPDGKHLATVFHQQSGRRSKGAPTYLVRWDVQSMQRTARFADPSKGSGTGARVGWWGNDFFWLAYINRSASLISWDKQTVVLRAPLRRQEKLCFGNSDGKCWFLATGPDGNAVLRGIDLPAEALKQTNQPMRLTVEGILR